MIKKGQYCQWLCHAASAAAAAAAAAPIRQREGLKYMPPWRPVKGI